ncbi:wyosine base formation [Bombardia bombarda]|uniref:S-adenosyl-L-methionine-dependent tRNA 4-demethylwyosine synthase n=1 Tax=Bombardia bombarda TaxID=252184 RepID=A0AA39X998_9PEZI|nr:wyosine base formation [Bombardia bombarda]
MSYDHWDANPSAAFALYAVELWHEHRIPIILTTFCALVVLRIYLHWTADQKPAELLVFPKIYQPEPEALLAPALAPEKKKEEVNNTIAKNDETTTTVEKEKKQQNVPRRIKGELTRKTARRGSSEEAPAPKIQVLIFYSSITANTEKVAKDFAQTFGTSLAAIASEGKECPFLAPKALDLAEVDYDEYFISPPKIENEQGGGPVELFYLFLIPSYNIDTINDNVLEHLQETHHDFRIDTAPLSSILGYSVFGFGDREGWPTEEDGFCFQAKEVDRWMAKLTARKRAFPLGVGDWKRDGFARLSEWQIGLTEVLTLLEQTGGLGEGVAGSGDPLESDDEADVDEDDGEVMFDDAPTDAKATKQKSAGSLEDVEDLGRIMDMSRADGTDAKLTRAPIAIDFTTSGKIQPKVRKATAAIVVKEMVPKNSPTYTSLTKQGYSIVGSHSGVKICRWTKSALRGRGSCYKYSFYGINSHQCMETTPSLSCSNKCVFCWRHGTNPVGTTWRWVVDPPQLIFDGVRENHYKKIKMMRGVPGVRAERFAEAMRIRHCALSLVGEPIFYPHINEFLGMLHAERISSFLVCNAQHPDELAALQHVTQLYVSIDASNRESLRRIDRPLHRDFWERFQRCLDILRERRFRQRTVFRLTLVKGFNVEDEAEGYADLVARGLPCFIEVKGVTYCGTSTSSNAGLTMANVPFYQEVCDFVLALERALHKRGLKYGIAAEHAHSCCILLGSERFNVDGKWHTLIDYEKFFELLEAKGPGGDFSPEDYMGAATPEWATWGNGGFDPRDVRVDRKGRPVEAAAVPAEVN